MNDLTDKPEAEPLSVPARQERDLEFAREAIRRMFERGMPSPEKAAKHIADVMSFISAESEDRTATVRTLQADNRALQKTNEELGPAYHDWRTRAEKAEAQVAELEAERDECARVARGYQKLNTEKWERAEKAEARVAELETYIKDQELTISWHTCCPWDARRLKQLRIAEERAEKAEAQVTSLERYLKDLSGFHEGAVKSCQHYQDENKRLREALETLSDLTYAPLGNNDEKIRDAYHAGRKEVMDEAKGIALAVLAGEKTP